MTGCANWLAQDRAIKVYPRPAKDTVVAVNLALRDLNFFPTDVVPTHSHPRPTFVTTAYREESLGEIVTVAVRDLEGEQSQVEVLTRGDVTGTWTWSIWWPPLIFEQTNSRLFALAPPQIRESPGSFGPTLAPRPPPPGRFLSY
jgi:hypothetical protein